jgi:hypothetical protein
MGEEVKKMPNAECQMPNAESNAGEVVSYEFRVASKGDVFTRNSQLRQFGIRHSQPLASNPFLSYPIGLHR